jgi:putative tricarboxylic transport membrane protein
MTTERPPLRSRPNLSLLTHTNVLAGLMFMAVAVLGLWLSRNYPIGTALRMGTGYVPRLLCWALLGLGAIIFVQGFLAARQAQGAAGYDLSFWRPLAFVTIGLVVFGLTLERLGLVISILLMLVVGAFGGRGLRVVEFAVAALVLIVLSWVIFIVFLGVAIPVWPEW